MGLPGQEAGPGASVAWPVTINLALLNTLPETVQVNFADRDLVTLTQVTSERSGNALSWTGEGGDCSGMFRVAADGGFKGTVSCLNAPYGIDHPAGSSALRLTRYDDSGQMTWDDAAAANESEDAESIPPPPVPMGGSKGTDTTVDILVLYNSALSNVNIWQDATDQIQTIRHAMEISTTAGQSTIAKVRLASAARITRNVSGLTPTELQFLKDSPQVAALRDHYAADIVLYLTQGTCIPLPGQVIILGISYIPGSNGVPAPPAPDYAFSAALYNCSNNPGDWVAAHEVGHVFGANHNMDQVPQNPTPLQPYAWGHWAKHLGTGDPIEGARTLLAYVDRCLDITDVCPRIQHYSNPNVVDDWFTTGTAIHDNARLIKLEAPTVAQYRDSLGRIFMSGFE
jgi:hypothetical protein